MDTTWLRSELSRSTEKAIVVTHHAPRVNRVADPKYGRLRRHLFGSNALETMPREKIYAWIFGHTHWSMDEMDGDVRLCNNPMGNATEVRTPQWPWKGFRAL